MGISLPSVSLNCFLKHEYLIAIVNAYPKFLGNKHEIANLV